MDLQFGIFGENLTSEGLLESVVKVGDRFQIGTAKFVVTAPRFPCFKLGIRFNRTDIIKRFTKSGRSGFYLTVEKPGQLETGDAIELLSREEKQPSIAEIVRKRFNL